MRPPLPFFENQRKCHDFAKQGPDCVHPQVKFTIQNVVLRVSRRKNSEIFSARSFFFEFLRERLWKCPKFTKPPLKNEKSNPRYFIPTLSSTHQVSRIFPSLLLHLLKIFLVHQLRTILVIIFWTCTKFQYWFNFPQLKRKLVFNI